MMRMNNKLDSKDSQRRMKIKIIIKKHRFEDMKGNVLRI